jgi:CheY-like chemotaxis protein
MKKAAESRIHQQEKLPTRKKSILVVDDSADFLLLNKIILETEDYEVFTAASGAEALVVLGKIAQPDLILLDMLMEGMSGPEFLLVFEEKSPEIFKNVPVVFLTGMDNPPMGKAAGFIRKPIDIDKFLEAVHRFISVER